MDPVSAIKSIFGGDADPKRAALVSAITTAKASRDKVAGKLADRTKVRQDEEAKLGTLDAGDALDQKPVVANAKALEDDAAATLGVEETALVAKEAALVTYDRDVAHRAAVAQVEADTAAALAGVADVAGALVAAAAAVTMGGGKLDDVNASRVALGLPKVQGHVIAATLAKALASSRPDQAGALEKQIGAGVGTYPFQSMTAAAALAEVVPTVTALLSRRGSGTSQAAGEVAARLDLRAAAATAGLADVACGEWQARKIAASKPSTFDDPPPRAA